VGNERATKTKDTDTQTQEPNNGVADPEKLDQVTQKRSGVTARAGGVAPEKLGSEKTLGRKRQR
jgi:hypothetical protein